jgi:isoquinoline 1-oxidoreductase subunit beta
LNKAAKKIEVVYQVPFLAHANMEPMNCVARVEDKRCEIWAPTQGQTLAQRTAAKITGLPVESVIVHTTFLGTGFGRRAEPDFIAEAVQLSKIIAAPVKVVWTREDDMKHDLYRPATYNRLAAGLNDEGVPTAWMHRIVGPSILGSHAQMLGMTAPAIDRTSVEGASDISYNIHNLRVEYINKEPGVPVGFWRSVGHSQNTFITESFIDEIAAAGRKDPYDLRRELLVGRQRNLQVLELAASRADWRGSRPKGRALGIAMAEGYGSVIAQAVEISVASDGSIRVHKVVCAVDCGMTVNPDTIEAQIVGATIFGLTAALNDAITLARGRIVESNFHDYPLLRMNEVPVVDVHIVKSREAPGGVGEIGVPAVAPAVANAIFAATGKRIRTLPIRLAKG